MKYLSMLERLDEGELVRAEDGGWLEELEVVHIAGLGTGLPCSLEVAVVDGRSRVLRVQEALGVCTDGTSG